MTNPIHPLSERSAKLRGWVNALLGIWLIVAPFALNYDYTLFTTARWNDLLVGLLVTFFALIRAVRGYRQGAWSWMNILLGVWLIMAPFVLGYAAYRNALWNDLVVGAIISSLALATVTERRGQARQ